MNDVACSMHCGVPRRAASWSKCNEREIINKNIIMRVAFQLKRFNHISRMNRMQPESESAMTHRATRHRNFPHYYSCSPSRRSTLLATTTLTIVCFFILLHQLLLQQQHSTKFSIFSCFVCLFVRLINMISCGYFFVDAVEIQWNLTRLCQL